VLAQEGIIEPENQFFATSASTPNGKMVSQARYVRYQSPHVKGQKRFVHHELNSYKDFTSFFKAIDWKKLWFNQDSITGRQETLELFLTMASSTGLRNGQFSDSFWDSLQRVGVWDSPALVSKLAKTCLDEITKRDQDGDEVHWIKRGKKDPRQLTAGDWKAWQRDISGNQLRLQFWRQSNQVEFACVEKAHSTYNPPTPG
jgi:hypothetical protein